MQNNYSIEELKKLHARADGLYLSWLVQEMTCEPIRSVAQAEVLLRNELAAWQLSDDLKGRRFHDNLVTLRHLLLYEDLNKVPLYINSAPEDYLSEESDQRFYEYNIRPIALWRLDIGK